MIFFVNRERFGAIKVKFELCYENDGGKGLYSSSMASLCSFNRCKAISFGFFVWKKQSYLLRNPPPKNVEEFYIKWIQPIFRKRLIIHEDAFKRKFPLKMRSEDFTGAFW